MVLALSSLTGDLPLRSFFLNNVPVLAGSRFPKMLRIGAPRPRRRAFADFINTTPRTMAEEKTT